MEDDISNKIIKMLSDACIRSKHFLFFFWHLEVTLCKTRNRINHFEKVILEMFQTSSIYLYSVQKLQKTS